MSLDFRSLVARQQDCPAAVRTELGGSLQRRAHRDQLLTQPVDRAGAIGQPLHIHAQLRSAGGGIRVGNRLRDHRLGQFAGLGEVLDREKRGRSIGQGMADFIGASETWGVRKPGPEFFAGIIDDAQVPAHAILHVGDRLDDDVLSAALSVQIPPRTAASVSGAYARPSDAPGRRRPGESSHVAR